MKKTDFKMGFWNYQIPSLLTADDVKYWDECGMTLTMSPGYKPDRDKKEDMLRIMDMCAERGIKLIICDSRVTWQGAAADPDAYRRRFTEAYADFGHHPATYGFHIGDEPFRHDTDDVIAAYRIQLEVAPELVPFVNFLPTWNGEYVGYKDFDEWSEDMLPRAGFRQICYDRYSQQNPEMSGTDDYFTDLRRYGELAEKYNIPMWTTLLCVGHFRYRPPTYNDLRWQLSTAVASGCTGILWFMFYLRMPNSNYRLAPLGIGGKPTQTYYDLSRVINEFTAMYGNRFSSLRLEKSYHLGRAFGGFELYCENMRDDIVSANPVYGINGIISFFRDAAGDEYVAVVNNSRNTDEGNTSGNASGQISLTISPKVKGLVRVYDSYPNTDALIYHHDEGFERRDDKVIYSPWLAPGQINLYKIVK